MSIGQGSIITQQKKQPSGPPFVAASAYNGLSVESGSGKIVLGQTIGEAGNPAVLLNNREIPFNSFYLNFKATGIANEYVGIGTSVPVAIFHVNRPSFNIVDIPNGNNGSVLQSEIKFNGTNLTGNRAFYAAYSGLTCNLNSNQTINNQTDAAAFYSLLLFNNSVAATLTMAQTGGGTRALAALKCAWTIGSMNAGSIITFASNLHVAAIFNPTQPGTITNYYGILIEAQDHFLPVNFTITNQFGIYQEGINDKNYFNGNIGIKRLPNTTIALQLFGRAGFSDDNADNFSNGPVGGNQVMISGSGNANQLQITRYGTAVGASKGVTIYLYKTRGASANIAQSLNNNDTIGAVEVWGVDTGNVNRLAARILIGAGTIGATFVPGNFYFQTTDNSGVTNNRLYIASNGQIGINTTAPNASALLQIESTTQGFLSPRMTTVQKNAIAGPIAGLIVYDTTLNKLCVFTTAWETITSV
jgi:hypothetical protein